MRTSFTITNDALTLADSLIPMANRMVIITVIANAGRLKTAVVVSTMFAFIPFAEARLIHWPVSSKAISVPVEAMSSPGIWIPNPARKLAK